MASPLFSICVYCGSRPGIDPSYAEAAVGLGQAIAREGWRLVYGAGDIGLMGAVAKAATEAGAEALGIIPQHLRQLEALKKTYGNQVVTETMHERKKVMLMNADAVVMLPGGAGSLDEFFEVLTWKHLGLHDKPIVLLNIEGYWAPLITLINHVVDQGFADVSLRDFVTVAENVEAAVAALRVSRTDH